MLSYITARVLMDRLDEAVGPENWQVRFPFAGCCEIGIRVEVKPQGSTPMSAPAEYEWIWKADGAGETAIEGEKGIFSDAFKRAGVQWGVGRELYPDSTIGQSTEEPREEARRLFRGLSAPIKTKFLEITAGVGIDQLEENRLPKALEWLRSQK